MVQKIYKILLIDDSALMRSVISDIINSDNRFKIVDTATDGMQGLDLLVSHNGEYDIVLLDVMMPKMSGLEVLENINRYQLKCKVIVMSALIKEGAKETILALEMGAVDFVQKPSVIRKAEKQSFQEILLVALNSAISLDSPVRLKYSARSGKNSAKRVKFEPVVTELKTVRHVFDEPVTGWAKSRSAGLVAIASSTGGPRTLKEIIPKLPKDLAAPVVIVQHMPAGFTRSLAERLNELSMLTVKEAEKDEPLRNGYVYIAPGGTQLRIQENTSGEPIFCITDDPPVGGLKPCANLMYESIADTSYRAVTCVVLTGMGADGTNGISSLSKKKKIHVIAQNAQTSVVYGMPRAIAEAGLTDEILPIEDVAGAIIKNVGVLNNGC